MRFSHSLNAAFALAGLGLTALVAAPAQAQGLNSQPVDVSFRIGPTGPTSTTTSDLGTQTVSPAGAAFSVDGVNVLVTPTQIRFTQANLSTLFGLQSGFQGFRIAETGPAPATIIGFLVDPATNVMGFDLSRVSGDPADIFANFQGLTITAGQDVTLDVFTAPPAVPEASTTVSLGLLLAFELGGIVLAKKRRKA